ncbi:uncharacterized protein LOC127004508 isoform X2 [Eriocheir sinensis]|uniref:uncharacterized protein LOC127004508 isoform X2 n=1 Tax=Eriocheir sinensis TaxID=95602 RepID=UPI0021CA13DA|nr:uncharacterized protein LOC127004508 isoform X2 [Eriocheir sinensis]
MVRMIGAMPAVAVRQQRKHVKHEDHSKHRPTTLTIDASTPYAAKARPPGTNKAKTPGARRGLPTPLRSPRGSPRASPVASPVASPKPSPVTSPRAQPKQVSTTGCAYRCVHGYLCGRVSLLHVSVVCVLLGITLLVVGLVQLAPGAAVVVVGSDSNGFPAGSVVNKYAIIGAGTGFLGLGFLLLIILCACQKNTHRRRRPPPHLVQPRGRGRKKGKRKADNVYAMDCVRSLSIAAQTQQIQKNRTGSGRSGKGQQAKGHTRQMQVQTVERGRVTGGGEGGGGSGGGEGGGEGGGGDLQLQDQETQQPGGIIDKEASLEGFVKSPSESDALLQSCSHH